MKLFSFKILNIFTYVSFFFELVKMMITGNDVQKLLHEWNITDKTWLDKHEMYHLKEQH
jgi:hypothetical protein